MHPSEGTWIQRPLAMISRCSTHTRGVCRAAIRKPGSPFLAWFWSIGWGNLQITLIESSLWVSSRGHVASQNNTSATGAYFGHLSFYCTHTATCQLVLYVPAGRKMSVHPRPQGKQKTHRTPERIKTPLVYPASSSKKKKIIQKYLTVSPAKA